MLLLTVQQDSERKQVGPLACRGEWDSAIAGDHCASNYHCMLTVAVNRILSPYTCWKETTTIAGYIAQCLSKMCRSGMFF